jgi:hypothetical protein
MKHGTSVHEFLVAGYLPPQTKTPGLPSVECHHGTAICSRFSIKPQTPPLPIFSVHRLSSTFLATMHWVGKRVPKQERRIELRDSGREDLNLRFPPAACRIHLLCMRPSLLHGRIKQCHLLRGGCTPCWAATRPPAYLILMNSSLAMETVA